MKISWSKSDIPITDIPDGYYLARITDVKESLSKSGKNMLTITLKLKDTGLNVYKWQMLEPSGRYNMAAIQADLARLCRCFNVPENSEIDTDDLPGRSSIIRISHSRDKDNPTINRLNVSFPEPEKAKQALIEQDARNIAQKKWADANASVPQAPWDDEGNITEPMF